MLVQLYGNIHTCEVCHLLTFTVPVKCHFFILKMKPQRLDLQAPPFRQLNRSLIVRVINCLLLFNLLTKGEN